YGGCASFDLRERGRAAIDAANANERQASIQRLRKEAQRTCRNLEQRLARQSSGFLAVIGGQVFGALDRRVRDDQRVERMGDDQFGDVADRAFVQIRRDFEKKRPPAVNRLKRGPRLIQSPQQILQRSSLLQ